jgi:hypothetical protein
MSASAALESPEHLTPHDLVTYFRCPHELEILEAQRRSRIAGSPVQLRTPLGTVAARASPLSPPPLDGLEVVDGRLEIDPTDTLVYSDPAEAGLPILFATEQIRLDPPVGAGATLIDRGWGLSGRPDFVVQRPGGAIFPIEYKSTHLFRDYRGSHGRLFDTLQVIAECRLVQVAWGRRPAHGIVYYGDASGAGSREGYVRIPYSDAEERWLRQALVAIRSDVIRAPVPSERHCGGCPPNRDGLCRFAAAPYGAGRDRGEALPRPLY